MRDPEDESRSIQVREGYSGWKVGMTFLRLYRGGAGGKFAGAGTFYTILALNENDDLVATATGRRDADVWSNIFAALRHKGYEIDE
jgi:hypothetical protein